jgi:hypothetical protein
MDPVPGNRPGDVTPDSASTVTDCLFFIRTFTPLFIERLVFFGFPVTIFPATNAVCIYLSGLFFKA